MNNKFLTGEKIYLREVREEDVNDEYYKWINDPDMNQFLETRFLPRSKKDIINHVSRLDGNPNEIFFAICDKNNDKHIGNI
jgi:RimJ/RimL family protein N-acetyltransferase